jgi:tetratricopeptide (TPR) repeat protein
VTGTGPAGGTAPSAPMRAALRLLSWGDRGAAAAFDRALEGEVAPPWRAAGLLGRGLAEELEGSPHLADASLRGALEIWTAADSDSGALALAALGRALAAGIDPEMADTLMDAARRLSAGRSAEVIGGVLLEMGVAAAERGEAATALRSWQEVLDHADPRSQAAAAANLGRLAAVRGDTTAALQLFARAQREPGGPHLRVIADGLAALASQAAAEGRYEEASGWLRECASLRRRDGDARGVAHALHDLGIAHWRRGELQAATRALEDCRGAAAGAGEDAVAGSALRALARVSLDGESPVVALAYATEAGAVARVPADRRAAATVLREVGDAARRGGASALSQEAFRAAAGLLASLE